MSAVLLLWTTAAPRPAAGEFQTIEVESLRIEFDSDWGVRTAPGYLPVRIDLRNLGDARVVEIVGQGWRHFRSRGGGAGGIDIHQAVRLGRGDRVRLTIPVPIFGNNENIRFEIQENGRTLERFNYTGFQSGSPPVEVSALIVVDRASPFGAVAPTWLRAQSPARAAHLSGAIVGPSGTAARSGTTGAPPLDFMLDPRRLPTNWLGYTSLRAVLIGPAEWERLSDAQRTALLTWTACGGDLFFVDGDWGALFPGRATPAAGTDDRAPRGYFFGRIHRPTSMSITASGLEMALTEAQKLQDSNWALPANSARDWGVIAQRGFRLPIPGITGVPARAYVAILIVFTLIIGPVNYFFMFRNRQPVLLVLTAPLISAVFVLLLGGYVLVGEGFAVRARAVTVTMLDQVRTQASTRSSISLYAAGMTPSGGLRFPRQMAVFPIGPEGTGSRDRQYVDLTDVQSLSSGVINARSPTNIEQIAFRTARERLSFNREAGEMTVVNGLGATVTALFYRVGDTIYTSNGSVAAGSKATLTIGAPPPAKTVPAGLPLTWRLAHLFEHQPPGSYLAVLERSPFWEPGVSSVVEQGSFHVVIGWPEGQP